MNAGTGKWPISYVLTAFYTLSASVILFLATGLLYWVMQRDLKQEDAHALADQVEILRFTLCNKLNDHEALKREVQSEGAARRFAKYYARVLDRDGNVLIETSEMGKLLSPEKFPRTEESSKEHERGIRWRSPAGQWFLLMSARAETGDLHESRLLQLALDVTQDEQVLSNYRQMLLIVLVLGIAGSAVVGNIVARKGMRPLAEIAEAAQKITASQLHERITPAKWPKELMTLATAFDEMLRRLEASFNRLSQFSDDLAHEFRTPITALRVQAEVALQRSRTVEEYQRVLESSLEEYERLSRMIESLLFLARSDNAETTLQRAVFDAATEIKGVCAYYDAATADKQVEVSVSGSGNIEADLILFRRTINNLLANALRHTEAGGKISIQTQSNGNGTMEIILQDTGCGIPEEHIPKVFDRFYRVDKSRNQQGAGLGLAIVKSIMELHGGSVELQSKPGNGTTVSLKFPDARSSTTVA